MSIEINCNTRMFERLFGFIGRMIGGEPKPVGKTTADVHTQTEKQKWTEEKELLRQELEDTKKFYDAELSKLKAKDHKSSTEQVQAFHSGSDINKEWQEKCDQLVSANEAKHQAALSTLKSQCSILEEKVKAAETKNDHVQIQASITQEKYQEQINNLEKSQDESNKRKLITEVKKIMSSVYHNLKKEFEEKSSYEGADINNTIMDTIKAVTMQMIQIQTEAPEDEDDHSAEISEVIVKEASPSTGGGGNPYYAAELEKKEISEVIVKEASPSTGGGGNPHYAAELEKKDKSKLEDIFVSAAAPAETERTKSNAEEINQKVDLLKSLVSQKDSTDQDQDSAKDTDVMPRILLQEASPTTGGTGNPYRAKEIQNSGP